MPIFEYKCSECGGISEFLEPHDSKKPKVCPHCGSRELVRQISTFAFGVKEGDSKSRKGHLTARCKGCSDQSCPHFYPP
jgi:putative FmdB family regulatory protein